MGVYVCGLRVFFFTHMFFADILFMFNFFFFVRNSVDQVYGICVRVYQSIS